MDSVSNEVKIKEALPVSKEFVSEMSLHQDEILERLTKMDASEYKKLYKMKWFKRNMYLYINNIYKNCVLKVKNCLKLKLLPILIKTNESSGNHCEDSTKN